MKRALKYVGGLMAAGLVIAVAGLWLTRYHGELPELLPEHCLSYLRVRDFRGHLDAFRDSPILEALRLSDWMEEHGDDEQVAALMQLLDAPESSPHADAFAMLQRAAGDDAMIGMFGPDEGFLHNFAAVSRLSMLDRLLFAYWLSAFDVESVSPPGERKTIAGLNAVRMPLGESPFFGWVAVHRGVLLMATSEGLLRDISKNFDRVSANRLTRKNLYADLHPEDPEKAFLSLCVFNFGETFSAFGRPTLREDLATAGLVTHFDFSENRYNFKTTVRHFLDLPESRAQGDRAPYLQPSITREAFFYAEASLWFWHAMAWHHTEGHKQVSAMRHTLTGIGERYASTVLRGEAWPGLLVESRPSKPEMLDTLMTMVVHAHALMTSRYVLDRLEEPFREVDCSYQNLVRASTLQTSPLAYQFEDGRLMASQQTATLCAALEDGRPAEESSFLVQALAERPPSCDLFFACDWEAFREQTAASRWRLEGLSPSMPMLLDLVDDLDYATGWIGHGTLGPEVLTMEAEIVF